jgi:ATP-dependent Clp protease, protease subunit
MYQLLIVYIYTAIAIINAMMVCHAEITGFIMGACHSAASIISMYCHHIHVFETAYMMIHTASFGNFGNTSTVKTQTDFTVHQVEKLLDDAYKGFLDKKELTEVKQGLELWYDSEEIRKRLKKRVAILEVEEKKNAKKLK